MDTSFHSTCSCHLDNVSLNVSVQTPRTVGTKTARFTHLQREEVEKLEQLVVLQHGAHNKRHVDPRSAAKERAQLDRAKAREYAHKRSNSKNRNVSKSREREPSKPVITKVDVDTPLSPCKKRRVSMEDAQFEATHNLDLSLLEDQNQTLLDETTQHIHTPVKPEIPLPELPTSQLVKQFVRELKKESQRSTPKRRITIGDHRNIHREDIHVHTRQNDSILLECSPPNNDTADSTFQELPQGIHNTSVAQDPTARYHYINNKPMPSRDLFNKDVLFSKQVNQTPAFSDLSPISKAPQDLLNNSAVTMRRKRVYTTDEEMPIDANPQHFEHLQFDSVSVVTMDMKPVNNSCVVHLEEEEEEDLSDNGAILIDKQMYAMEQLYASLPRNVRKSLGGNTLQQDEEHQSLEESLQDIISSVFHEENTLDADNNLNNKKENTVHTITNTTNITNATNHMHNSNNIQLLSKWWKLQQQIHEQNQDQVYVQSSPTLPLPNRRLTSVNPNFIVDQNRLPSVGDTIRKLNRTTYTGYDSNNNNIVDNKVEVFSSSSFTFQPSLVHVSENNVQSTQSSVIQNTQNLVQTAVSYFTSTKKAPTTSDKQAQALSRVITNERTAQNLHLQPKTALLNELLRMTGADSVEQVITTQDHEEEEDEDEDEDIDILYKQLQQYARSNHHHTHTLGSNKNPKYPKVRFFKLE